MVLEGHPLTDADIDEWVRIIYHAVQTTPLKHFWLREPSEESYQALAASRRKELRKPNAFAFKCIDTELDNKIISVSNWVITHPKFAPAVKEVTPADNRAQGNEDPPVDQMPELNTALLKSAVKVIIAARKEVLADQPHITLERLTTHVDHHGRGAGRLLMKWGLDMADELGIIAHLESSPAGVKLYESCGFERVKDIALESDDGGPVVIPVMIRKPHSNS